MGFAIARISWPSLRNHPDRRVRTDEFGGLNTDGFAPEGLFPLQSVGQHTKKNQPQGQTTLNNCELDSIARRMQKEFLDLLHPDESASALSFFDRCMSGLVDGLRISVEGINDVSFRKTTISELIRAEASLLDSKQSTKKLVEKYPEFESQIRADSHGRDRSSPRITGLQECRGTAG